MKKQLSLILILLIISVKGFSQKIDYLDVRDSLTSLSCGQVDIETLYITETKLLQFDTLSVTKKNLFKYYRDLAWCYYHLWIKTMDIKYAELSIKYNKQTIISNPKVTSSYWDIALINSFLGNCEIMNKYLEKYKKVEEKKYIDNNQINELLKHCGNLK